MQKEYTRRVDEPINYLQLDATKALHPNAPFPYVVVDAPCSGSGTWRHQPERLLLSNQEDIRSYSATQLSLLTNTAKAVIPGGKIIYITCSVFKHENEDIVEAILDRDKKTQPD